MINEQRMNWTIFINPFRAIPDKLLMLLGIISFIIGCYLSYHHQVIYDGIFDVHKHPDILFSQAFTANIVNIVIFSILFFAFGRTINPKIRMIDVLNTALIARIPIYLSVPLIDIPVIKRITENIMSQIDTISQLKLDTADLIALIIFSSVTLLLLVYSITLMVSGFRTASNMKKLQQYVVFAVLIIIAEVLAKWIVSMI